MQLYLIWVLLKWKILVISSCFNSFYLKLKFDISQLRQYTPSVGLIFVFLSNLKFVDEQYLFYSKLFHVKLLIDQFSLMFN